MPMLEELLVEQMQDLLHAEGQLVKALPKMAKAAHDPKLKQAFEKHLEETKGQVERLKQAFELLGAKAKAKPCKGMQGLIEEGQEIHYGRQGEGRTRSRFGIGRGGPESGALRDLGLWHAPDDGRESRTSESGQAVGPNARRRRED